MSDEWSMINDQWSMMNGEWWMMNGATEEATKKSNEPHIHLRFLIFIEEWHENVILDGIFSLIIFYIFIIYIIRPINHYLINNLWNELYQC